ncbi:MAG TPA: gluconokinase [Candidatus Acidoferrales bacterium]|nr:gluconokinase [Candidatus Acidoferrales bacterium]
MIGLDIGTTNCKAVVLDSDGRLVAHASESYALRTPHPGWAEQDVLVLWGAVVRCLRAVAGSALVEPAGICFSGAMHSCFPVDSDGAPLAPAMTWADNRAAPFEGLVRSEVDVAALYARTGCPVRSTYHPVRLRWWADAAPELTRRAARFVSVKDWILHALAGAWATDVGLASTTGLLDIVALSWDAEALDAGRVRPELLPSLVPSTAVVDGLAPDAAAATGLPAGLPIVAGGSDGATANLGTGIATAGQAVITVGTSGAIRQLADRPWIDPSERTWCYVADGERWLVGGAINNGGLALEWARAMLYPELGTEDGFQRMTADAGTVAAGADGVFLLPYFAGERSPAWTPTDPAMAYGLRLGQSRAHLARATMEGVAHCLADVWDVLPAPAHTGELTRLTGGITRAPVWAQILADVIGEPLMAVDAADASATGAALLGLRALGGSPALGEMPAGQTGPVYAPGADRAFYVRHHRAFDALRARMRDQEAVLDAVARGGATGAG